MMQAIAEAISRNRIWYCLECGRCSAACPITRWEKRNHTGPRTFVENAIDGDLQRMLQDHLFWSCLTCRRCSQLCPSGVHFPEFMQAVRSVAREQGFCGECTHGGTIQAWGRMMTDPTLKQERLGWLGGDLKTSRDSDTLYFSGCLPQYDTLFMDLKVEGTAAAGAALRILNHLGIQPQVLADERCCGHDPLWQGDFETFRGLGMLNMEMMKASGAKRIVTNCPECARTLKVDYPQWFGPHGMQVLHIAELLAQSGLTFTAGGRRVTYQDPCRLGRHLGVYDAPRRVLAAAGFELVEMERTRAAAQCCGTTCWTNCGQVSRNIQVERLQEARATGAELLITACPKCQIHFKCAQRDPTLGEGIGIEIRDLATLVAERL